MINLQPAVTSRSVWSARFEPGPRTLNGESVLLIAETTTGAQATPAATGEVWKPHVRVRLFRIGALLEARAPQQDVAGRPVVAVPRVLAHHDPDAGLPARQRPGDLEPLPRRRERHLRRSREVPAVSIVDNDDRDVLGAGGDLAHT
jgi:hypothetical protein